MSPVFEVQPYDRYDKYVEILGPDQLSLRVDYDDVDQHTVDVAMSKMLAILNREWATEPKRKYEGIDNA